MFCVHWKAHLYKILKIFKKLLEYKRGRKRYNTKTIMASGTQFCCCSKGVIYLNKAKTKLTLFTLLTFARGYRGF